MDNLTIGGTAQTAQVAAAKGAEGAEAAVVDKNVQTTAQAGVEVGSEQKNPWEGINVPEEYSSFKDKYKGGVNEVFKALSNANKLIGQKAITKPTAESSDEEKTAWRKHIGVPEKLEEYDFEIGEDIKPYLDKEYFASAKQKAFDAGFTKEQFELMANMRFEEFRNVQNAVRNKAVLDTENCRMALKKEWGEDAEAFTKEVYDLAKENKIYDKLSQLGVLNDADFVKFVHLAASAMNEGGVPSQNTLSTIDSQIKALMSSEGYKNRGSKDYMPTMKRLAELNERKAKAIPR